MGKQQEHLRSEAQAAEESAPHSLLEFGALSAIALLLAAGAYAALRLHALHMRRGC